MRPIDADALTRELKSIKTTFGSGKGLVEGGLEIAISTTNAMPTISEWIPCSERLPQVGHPVLWCNERGSVFVSAITAMDDSGWAIGKRHRRLKVVAWMPLPAPWEEGEPNG